MKDVLRMAFLLVSRNDFLCSCGVLRVKMILLHYSGLQVFTNWLSLDGISSLRYEARHHGNGKKNKSPINLLDLLVLFRIALVVAARLQAAQDLSGRRA